MMNKKDSSKDSALFWKMAKDFINHRISEIRQLSPNTVKAYRDSLNQYINYLEAEKNIKRSKICFDDFNKNNLVDYIDWMLNIKKYAPKTCNLRITAINALLEYVANENTIDLMNIYLEATDIKGIKVPSAPIEYFESHQIKALLAAPDKNTRTGRRNQMMLILYYDTGARISELLEMKLNQLHLDADIPYLTILGKGRKYRNIPLMDKTVAHLKNYIQNYHCDYLPNNPLFYAKTHGIIHHLSHDTVEAMIKKYSKQCIEKGIKMPDNPHCHMIRKTRAMDLYKGGMSLPHIQQLLGHENISTTSGFYAFATIETLSKAMEKANKDMTGQTKKWNKKVLDKIYAL